MDMLGWTAKLGGQTTERLATTIVDSGHLVMEFMSGWHKEEWRKLKGNEKLTLYYGSRARK